MSKQFEEYRKIVEIGIERGWIRRPQSFTPREIKPWQDGSSAVQSPGIIGLGERRFEADAESE